MIAIVISAATALANLASENPEPPYKCGVYLFHPIFKQKVPSKVDVVFIHGVNGASAFTWRQHPDMRGGCVTVSLFVSSRHPSICLWF